MRRFAAVVLTLLLAVTACKDPGASRPSDKRRPTSLGGVPIAAGSHKLTFTVGVPRESVVHVPPRLAREKFSGGKPAKPLPVVIALHGGADTMYGYEKKTGFDKLADEHGFLAVYPNGIAFSWNAGQCCGPAKVANTDDTGFVDKLIDRLTGSGLADPKRVYVTGFSNGGGLAYRLACEGPGKIAAIGVVSAALAMTCKPDHPVSVMVWHGTADPGVPYNGGGRIDWNVPKPFPPVSHAIDFWRKTDDLPAPHKPAYDRCQSTGKGGNGTEVVLCKVQGGGHAYPAGASRLMWDFFTTHTHS